MTFNDVMIIFGVLVAGIIIMRFGIRRSTKPPRRGRMFRRKFDED